MSDIKLTYDNNTQTADWLFENGDFAQSDCDLETAVLVSIGTDAASTNGFVDPGSLTKRGCWMQSDLDYVMGTETWQIPYMPVTNVEQVERTIENMDQRSLQVFVDQTIVGSVKCDATLSDDQSTVTREITLTKPTGETKFSFAWTFK